MNPTVIPPPLPASQRLLPVLGGMAILTLVTDLLLWNASPGASLGLVFLFWGIVVGIFWFSRGGGKEGWFLGAMLVLSAAQCAWEVGFSNVIVMLALVVSLLGLGHYAALPSAWGRFSEAVWNLVRAPFRWGWVAWSILSSCNRWGGILGKTGMVLLVLLPALLLGGIFLGLLAGGNAVLAHGLERTFQSLWDWLCSLEINIARIFFWAAVATLALVWVSPFACPPARRWWDQPSAPRGNDPAPYLKAVGLASLATVNVVFFMANSIDTVFLWMGGRLPDGVNPSAYLHEGVAFLIVAVLLSALVLVTLAQQNGDMVRNRWFRGLAFVWIAQNLLVLGGVIWRLKLYVEAFQWSEQRVYVAFFVALVAAGFVLLARYVPGHKTLGWLFWRNAQAVFVLFFIVQFLDVRGAVARWNVGQWERKSGGTLDVEYLARLGPSAWPELYRVSRSGEESSPQKQAGEKLAEARTGAVAYLAETGKDWRGWQGRKDRLARWLIEQKLTKVTEQGMGRVGWGGEL